MRSLALAPQRNSFIRENHGFRITQSELEYLAQKVRSVISIFLGEYFIDQSLGIPYIPETDMKTGHRAILETALRTKIVAIKGIRKLVHFVSVYEPGSRKLYIDFVAETDANEILELEEDFTTPNPGGEE